MVLGVTVLAGVGMTVVVVVVLILYEIIVAVPGCLVVTGMVFRILCNKFG